VTTAVIEQIKADPAFAKQVAEQLEGKAAFFAIPSHELIPLSAKLVEAVGGVEVCRVDVAQSSDPVNARMSEKDVFWVRMNNSTRALPEVEVEDYVRDHW